MAWDIWERAKRHQVKKWQYREFKTSQRTSDIVKAVI